MAEFYGCECGDGGDDSAQELINEMIQERYNDDADFRKQRRQLRDDGYGRPTVSARRDRRR